MFFMIASIVCLAASYLYAWAHSPWSAALCFVLSALCAAHGRNMMEDES